MALDLQFPILYVRDLEASITYYAAIVGDPVERSPGFAMFVFNSGARLGLWAADAVAPKPRQAGRLRAFGRHLAREGRRRAPRAMGGARRRHRADADADGFRLHLAARDPDGHRLRVFAPGD